MSFNPMDAFDGGTSNCCGARIYMGGLCFECGEHCEAEEDEDEEPARDFTPEQQAIIASIKEQANTETDPTP